MLSECVSLWDLTLSSVVIDTLKDRDYRGEERSVSSIVLVINAFTGHHAS